MSRSSEWLPLLVSVAALVGLLFVATGEGFAQPPGRGFRGFDGLDQDGSGVIERAELENLPDRFRERLESLIEEGEPGITRERFEESMQNFRSRWRDGRGPMRGEGEPAEDRPDAEKGDQNGMQGSEQGEFRRSRRNRNDDPASPEEKGDKRPNGEKGATVVERAAPAQPEGARPRYRQRKTGDKSSATASDKKGSGKKESEPAKPERVGLPEEWQKSDGDGDGQIGLYECPRERFVEFRLGDLNRDGFLTAAEIRRATQVSEEKTVTVIQPAVETASETPAAAQTADSPAEAAKGEALAAVAHIPKDVQNEADAAFKRLDVDSSGTIEPAEWSVSKRLKPRFEGAGVDLSKPISHLDFLKSYAVAVPKK
jgi:EF hand